MQHIHHDNPHVRQNPEAAYEFTFSRTLDRHAPRAKYRPSAETPKKTLRHWGQRKLLMAEIEFLTIAQGAHPRLVVYAGAAPGYHIHYLTHMFPQHFYLLVDPGTFDPLLASNPRVFVCQRPFSHTLAQVVGTIPFHVVHCAEQSCAVAQVDREDLYAWSELRDIPSETKEGAKPKESSCKHVLFISDIRTNIDASKMSAANIETIVAQDMQTQMEWHRLMRPRASMLKFRPPWDDKKTRYLRGTLLLQPWSPPNSTEARLVVMCDDERKDPKKDQSETDKTSADDELTTYDNRMYEEQMCFWNTRVRPSCFRHAVQEPSLDHCFDCTSEVHILLQYLLSCARHGDSIIQTVLSTAGKDVHRQVAALSRDITKCLSRSPED